MVEAAQEGDVQNTRVDVDVFGDDVHHFSGGGVLGDLGTEVLLVVDGSDDSVAGGAHGLQHRTHLVQAVARDGGGDGQDGELVVEQGVVAVLVLVVLGHGDHTVFLLHVSHDGVLQLQEAEGGHGTLTVSEHLADVGPDLSVVSGGDIVGAAVGVMEQVNELIGRAVEAVHIQHHPQLAVGVLFDDVQLAGAPVCVDVGVGAADKSVGVGHIPHAVAVVPIEQRDELGLLIQGPAAVLDVIVQVGLGGVGEALLVEHRDEAEAVHGQDHGAQNGVLGALVLHGLVETLGPPDLVEVQVIAVVTAEVDEGAVQSLGQGGVAGGGHDVVILRAALDGEGDSVDYGMLTGVVVLNADDLDAEAFLHGLVPFKDHVVDRLALHALHGDLAGGPALLVAADDGDLVAVVIQVVGQVVVQTGILLGEGLGGCAGLVGGVDVIGAGCQGGEQHDGGQECRQNAGLSHKEPPFHFLPFHYSTAGKESQG